MAIVNIECHYFDTQCVSCCDRKEFSSREWGRMRVREWSWVTVSQGVNWRIMQISHAVVTMRGRMMGSWMKMGGDDQGWIARICHGLRETEANHTLQCRFNFLIDRNNSTDDKYPRRKVKERILILNLYKRTDFLPYFISLVFHTVVRILLVLTSNQSF